MKGLRILTLFCIILAFVAEPCAQTKRKATATKQQTVQKKKTVAAKPKQKTQTATKQQAPTVKGLKSQQQKLRQDIKAQEKKLQANRADVKQRLQNLMIINSEIEGRRKTLDTIQTGINDLSTQLKVLQAERDTLEKQLAERKDRYLKSMKYMRRNHSIQNRIMFIFSAKNLTQMYRRLRFTRDYAAYQRNQGEAVKSKKAEVEEKYAQIAEAKRQRSTLYVRERQQKQVLEGKQQEQQQVVTTLQKQQKNIEQLIAQQKQKDLQLNAQIDKLVAEEAARAKARAEAEARRKAEQKRKAEEAARKAELARKKLEAERAARENERRIAEAKKKEREAKARAKETSRKNAAAKAAAERAAREAERERKAAEVRAANEKKLRNKEIAEAKREAKKEAWTSSSVDRRLSGNFESNKGRLPMPVTGSYQIVNRFGRYSVEGLKGVYLDNKGIDIKAQSGAQVRSVYDGEVSAIFTLGGQMVVMVRHGSYISVYCNLRSVSVSRGQQVSTRQTLGTLGGDNILKFQLRKKTSAINPLSWLGR